MSHSDVYVGRDGWLFLIGGRNSVLRQYRRSPQMWWRLRRWRSRIEARAARCQRLGVLFLQVVVPEKLTIMSHQTAETLVDPALSPAMRLAALMARSPAASRYLDLVDPLLVAAADRDIYLRTDTHWNYTGCFLGYKLMCALLGATARDDLLDRPFQTFNELRDLGIKLSPPIPEHFRVHNTMEDATRRYVNEVVTAFFAGGGTGRVTGTEAVYDNRSPRADPRRVLIFGDSYAHFDPLQLTGMLAETFREVRFVWSSSVDWRVVEEMQPDILICEIAERFLVRVPDDRFDLQAAVNARVRAR
ncbi:MAG: hypothetical protein NVSMB26_25930 [Beijerinckiaceae bacterium]